MEEINNQPTNGIIEPDFLQYLIKTFKRWNKLRDENITLGTREIAEMQWMLYGAKQNARFGFEAVARRYVKEGEEHFTLMIYRNKEELENGKPLYFFDTLIHK